MTSARGPGRRPRCPRAPRHRPAARRPRPMSRRHAAAATCRGMRGIRSTRDGAAGTSTRTAAPTPRPTPRSRSHDTAPRPKPPRGRDRSSAPARPHGAGSIAAASVLNATPVTMARPAPIWAGVIASPKNSAAAAGTDQRLDVDERAGDDGRDPRLAVGEQHPRHQRPDDRQGQHAHDRPGARHGRRGPLGDDGDRQRGHRSGQELHGGHGHRVAALEHPHLGHGHRRTDRQGEQDQAVAVQLDQPPPPPATTATPDQRDDQPGPGLRGPAGCGARRRRSARRAPGSSRPSSRRG